MLSRMVGGMQNNMSHTDLQVGVTRHGRARPPGLRVCWNEVTSPRQTESST